MQAATVKDVLYALEYGGQQLCGRPNPRGRGFVWQMEPSRQPVADRVANEARDNPNVVTLTSGFDEARYGWRAAE